MVHRSHDNRGEHTDLQSGQDFSGTACRPGAVTCRRCPDHRWRTHPCDWDVRDYALLLAAAAASICDSSHATELVSVATAVSRI